MTFFDDDDSLDNGGSPKPDPVTPPSAAGEEDPFSGDATNSESLDIDKELGKVGLKGDDDGVKPLDVDEDLQDETY